MAAEPASADSTNAVLETNASSSDKNRPRGVGDGEFDWVRLDSAVCNLVVVRNEVSRLIATVFAIAER